MVANESEFKAALINVIDGGTIKLTAGFTLTDNIFTPADPDSKSFAIDLNGQTLNSGEYILMHNGAGELTIKDSAGGGMITAKYAAIVVNYPGTVNFAGGEITASGKNCSGIYYDGGTVNVTGGTIRAIGINGDGIHGKSGTVNVIGGTSAITIIGDDRAINAGDIPTITLADRFTASENVDGSNPVLCNVDDIQSYSYLEFEPKSIEDNDGNPPPPAPTEDAFKIGTSAVVTVVDSDGNAVVNVTNQVVNDAIKAAQDAAKKDNLIGKMITLEIDVWADKSATKITAILPKDAQETLINNNIAAIKITTGAVTMSFSQAAIQQINAQAQADVTITAAKSDTSKLNGDAKNLIGTRPMFDFNATYGNGKRITNFDGNTVSISIPYILAKGEVPGNIYAIYVDSNGKATKIQHSSYDTNKQVAMLSTGHFSQYAVGYQASYSFDDIETHWAKTDIEFATNRGYISGTSKTQFYPDNKMTRGMFMTALGKLAGVDANSYKTGRFADVKADASYAPYVNWAVEKGIASGITAVTFSPDNVITRQEMAVFMSNYALITGYSVPEVRNAIAFTDNAFIGSGAAEAVKQMQMAGVINGKNGNKFDPTGAVTRAEAAAVIHRYIDLTIDKNTAQGLDINDSGSTIMYENGSMAKSTSRTVAEKTYNFNANGEAPIQASTTAVKANTYTVQEGDSFWSIAKKNKCNMLKLTKINNMNIFSFITAGDVLKIPQAQAR